MKPRDHAVKFALRCVVCMLCGLGLVFAQGAKDVLRIGSMDLPPWGFYGLKGEPVGVVYEMNEEIGRHSGMRYTNELLPFARMLEMLKHGELDMISSQSHTAALAAGDPLVPLYKIDVVVVMRNNSTAHTLAELKGARLVYHLGASYSQLEGLPAEIYRVNDYRQSVLMLHSRPWVDGAVFSAPSFFYWINKLELSRDEFGAIIPVELGKVQWVFVRHGLPEDIRTRIEQAVAEVTAAGTYEKLVEKYVAGPMPSALEGVEAQKK